MISAGGTGGGVYPALAVAQSLSRDHPDAALVWVGGIGGMEAGLVGRAGLPWVGIHAGAIHGVGFGRLVANTAAMGLGLLESLGLIRRLRPKALLVTGGFVTLPVALAAWLSRVPIMLVVPDIEPGWALKVLGRLATRIALTAEASQNFFSDPDGKQVVISGYPTRPGMELADRAHARQFFKLEPGLKTVLVFGGSRGARSINRALLAALPKLLAEAHVIHVSGELDWPEIEAASGMLPDGMRMRYHPYPYLHDEMALALAAADLVVSRAGASILGEYPLFGLPSVVVPYPHAWRYQRVNAEHLTARGAAVMVKDEDLPVQLLPTVLGLMRDPARLRAMGEAARELHMPDAARRIAGEFHRLGQSREASRR